MPAPTVHFLLVYSHKEQKLLAQDEFKDSTRATRAYAEAERKHANESDYEIVLIGSDSINTVMKTHGHYFSGESEFLRDGILLDA
jgi:diadenosine tetraphosphate (Ap4A) HIT family hydrolase